MTDYTKSTGSSGTMMIRDNGTTVYFYLKGASGTFNHDLPWGFTVNGITDTRTVDFVGDGGYQLLGTFTVNNSTTATFRIFDSGTSGVGGPTTLSVDIDRGSKPPAPTPFLISTVSATYVKGDSDSNGTGGLPVDRWQIGYGPKSSGPVVYTDANDTGSATIQNLALGTTYYFWSRRHNAKGWSDWSGRTQAITLDVPPAPTTPSASFVGQNSITVTFHNQGDGGTTVLEWQLAYGLSSTNPENTLSTNGTSTIQNLSAGNRYYFRARGRNSVGWGPWSSISTALLKAGAYVDYAVVVNGVTTTVKKRAVPYQNVDGVWKVVQPWVKIGGLWKTTE